MKKTSLPDEMIMNESHDFLSVQHEHIGFLINQDPFFASVYLENVGSLPSSATAFSHCGGTMVFRQETLLVYELDECLGALFRDPPKQGLKIALIADIQVFEQQNRNIFQQVAGAVGPGICDHMIALRICSQAEVCSLPLNRIRMLPGRMKSSLYQRGILGCYFPDARGASFMVDIETILFEDLKTV